MCGTTSSFPITIKGKELRVEVSRIPAGKMHELRQKLEELPYMLEGVKNPPTRVVIDCRGLDHLVLEDDETGLIRSVEFLSRYVDVTVQRSV